MSLVVTRVSGGLGNQMFQYAAGRALSLRCGASLKLDPSFDAPVPRWYELDAFPIPATFVCDADLAAFDRLPRTRPDWLDRAWTILRFGRDNYWPTYVEPHFHFEPEVLALQAPIYLEGYWQSEKYFADCAELLRRDFTPTPPLEPENAVFAAQIDEVNAVSLHVRRGDFANFARSIEFHGTCSLDYYRRAIEYLSSHVEVPHFFVFSDDWEWTRDNLRSEFPMTIVNANRADRGYRDLQLMARCRHHIIANSTLSWWGAWLNPSREKIVVAPTRWFNNAGADTRDLIPAAWVRL